MGASGGFSKGRLLFKNAAELGVKLPEAIGVILRWVSLHLQASEAGSELMSPR